MVKRNPLYVDPVMELLTQVVDSLLADESTRLDKVLQDLILRNHSLGGHLNAFIHVGEIFHILPRRLFRGEHIPALHLSMAAEAENLKTLCDNIKRDRRRLYQAFSVVLPKCHNKQEVRDVLPETLVAAIPAFRGVERQQEEGFILDAHPVLKEQYQQAVELALSYQANKLIY